MLDPAKNILPQNYKPTKCKIYDRAKRGLKTLIEHCAKWEEYYKAQVIQFIPPTKKTAARKTCKIIKKHLHLHCGLAQHKNNTAIMLQKVEKVNKNVPRKGNHNNRHVLTAKLQ